MQSKGKLNGLSLFSGIGGIDVALSEWVKPIAYCEIDPYCQGVLLSRISDGSLPNAPIWDDIKTLSYDGRNWPGIDIIYGGFPCQDISITGHGKGLEGKRSGLFFEILRLAKEIKPKVIFLENVPAITSKGASNIIYEISSLGYDCRWCIISAASIGALQIRQRWFLLAYSKSQRLQEIGQPIGSEKKFSLSTNETKHSIWDKEPENKFELAGMVNGLSHRMDRIKALGNAVVPQQAKEAFKILVGIEKSTEYPNGE